MVMLEKRLHFWMEKKRKNEPQAMGNWPRTLQECADARGVTPLLAAAGLCGSLPLVELLLDAKVHRYGSTHSWLAYFMENLVQ